MPEYPFDTANWLAQERNAQKVLLEMSEIRNYLVCVHAAADVEEADALVESGRVKLRRPGGHDFIKVISPKIQLLDDGIYAITIEGIDRVFEFYIGY